MEDESRHIWRIYLEQGKFQLATKHCANQVSGKHSPVFSSVVDESRHIWRTHLEQGKFQLSTKHCANQVSGGHSPVISSVVDTVLSLVQWWTQSCH